MNWIGQAVEVAGVVAEGSAVEVFVGRRVALLPGVSEGAVVALVVTMGCG